VAHGHRTGVKASIVLQIHATSKTTVQKMHANCSASVNRNPNSTRYVSFSIAEQYSYIMCLGPFKKRRENASTPIEAGEEINPRMILGAKAEGFLDSICSLVRITISSNSGRLKQLLHLHPPTQYTPDAKHSQYLAGRRTWRGNLALAFHISSIVKKTTNTHSLRHFDFLHLQFLQPSPLRSSSTESFLSKYPKRKRKKKLFITKTAKQKKKKMMKKKQSKVKVSM
jgi:hypothetical protein